MPSPSNSCVEDLALKALADLERLEGPWLALMKSGDPESVAVALRLGLVHAVQTMRHLQIADVIQTSVDQTEMQELAEGCRVFAQR